MATSAALYRSEIIGDSSPFKRYEQSGTAVAAVQSQRFPYNEVKLWSHSVAPHIATKYGDKGAQMSLPNPTRTFRERFSDALRRRLAPKTNLTVSQLAGALGVSDQTIKNLLSKANEPSARVIDACVAMFRDSFLNEIYGCHNVHVICTRTNEKAVAVRKLMEAQDELRRLG